MIDSIGLRPHAKKQARYLSGGNKRKLNFAIALFDYPSVILLDEPTTGMDPKARRAAWMCLSQATQQGCSIVTTSHSMEECEAVCDRIVVMIDGQFRCIGSAQHLKNKFGNSYNVKLKLSKSVNATVGNSPAASDSSCPDSAEAKLDAAVDLFAANFGMGAAGEALKIAERHSGYLEFQLPDSNDVSVAQVFRCIAECQTALGFEEFSITQTTLEQVFVQMAQTAYAPPTGILLR